MQRATKIGHTIRVIDGGVPPVVMCTVCGRTDCPGCSAPEQTPQLSPILPWESPGNTGERLWNMALASSLSPLRTFGELPDGPLAPAMVFALIAESVAILSLAVLALSIACSVSPDLMRRVLVDPAAIGLIAGAAMALVGLLVALHVLWGLCLEAGTCTASGQPRWRLGVRFGLYACGWDLLTSPAGVLLGVLTRGPVAAWAPLVAASRVPRVAMRAYLVHCRKFDARARRRASIISAAVLGAAMLLIVAGLVAGAVRVAIFLGI